MFALRRLQQALARSVLPLQALTTGPMQQQAAAVTSGPAGAVYTVGKASPGHAAGADRPQIAAARAACQLHRRRRRRLAARSRPPTRRRRPRSLALPPQPPQATNIKFHDGMVPRETKEELLGQRGCVLWFTGAPPELA